MNINSLSLAEKIDAYNKLLEKEKPSNADKIDIRKLKKFIDSNESPVSASGVFVPEGNGSSTRLVEVQLSKITMNPFQPRKTFDEEKLQELSTSILEHGLHQPITLSDNNGVYTLIAGERRYRAHQLANLETIKAVVYRNKTNEELKQLSIIENIQRDDLNCIEEAIAFKELNKDGLTVRELVKVLNKSQTYIQDRLRLSKLSSAAIELINEHKLFNISKITLLADEVEGIQIDVIKKIIEKNLTIDEIKALLPSCTIEPKQKAKVVSKPYPFKLERITGVELKANKKKIDISIDLKQFENKDTSSIKEYIEKILEEINKK